MIIKNNGKRRLYADFYPTSSFFETSDQDLDDQKAILSSLNQIKACKASAEEACDVMKRHLETQDKIIKEQKQFIVALEYKLSLEQKAKRQYKSDNHSLAIMLRKKQQENQQLNRAFKLLQNKLQILQFQPSSPIKFLKLDESTMIVQ